MALGQSVHSFDSLRRKYGTSRLSKKIAEHSDPEKLNWWDWDPFTKAQDFDTATLRTLSIRRGKKGPNSYSVSYRWTDYFTKITDTFTIHLIVIRQKERFKIDDVW